MTKEIRGLSREEVIRSKNASGDNALTREKTKGFIRKFLENLSDPIIKVLLFAVLLEVIFTFGHCDFLETGGILLAVLIATTVSTVSEYGSEKAFLKMQEEEARRTVRVIRDGREEEIPLDEIVVGDVVILAAGMTVPADGILLSGRLSVCEAALNGESAEVEKHPGEPFPGELSLSDPVAVFRGSDVTAGGGKMRVLRVGGKTFYGMVARDVQTETRESPLKLRLSKLAGQISRIGYALALVVGLTYLYKTFVIDNGYVGAAILSSFRDLPFLIRTLSHALTLMITVTVVAVPEGLPMMITVVLSANMKKMLRDGIMVKKLVGIETAGSLNILFTDKTGTLTTGKLSLSKVVTSAGEYRSAAELFAKEPTLAELFRTAAGAIEAGGGNATSRALADFFKGKKQGKTKVARVMPFSSETKFSAVELSGGETVLIGAPEVLLERTNGVFSESAGKNGAEIEGIRERLREETAQGARVIAVCLRDESAGKLFFLALAVLSDRLRRGVRESVAKIREAGVQVVMLTGDGRETAARIASECGILSHGGIVLSRDEFAAMSDEEVEKILPRLAVLSRALPQDKTRLVKLSQKLGLVAGMTGDGVNDAPSLKLSDVGFAMGSGTDVAKGAGDIVILDDSFSAITKSVLYGRTIFHSIRKFISFQLMMNLAACGVTLFGQFFGIDSPITIVQMLWVNIIMDTLGGLAFAGEPPLVSYMKEKPKRREEPILTGGMLRRIFATGGYTLALCLVFLKSGAFRAHFRPETGDAVFLTAFYVLFIFAGIFNCFNARSERLRLFDGITRNRAFLFVMASISVIQILMVYFGGSLFRTVPLSPSEFFMVVLLAASVIPFDFLRRVFVRLI